MTSQVIELSLSLTLTLRVYVHNAHSSHALIIICLDKFIKKRKKANKSSP